MELKEITAEIQNIADQIIHKYNPQKIILFGSAGCGEYEKVYNYFAFVTGFLENCLRLDIDKEDLESAKSSLISLQLKQIEQNFKRIEFWMEDIVDKIDGMQKN